MCVLNCSSSTYIHKYNLFYELLIYIFSYTAEDDEYTYHIGICTDPMAGQSGPDPDEAVVQIKKSDNKLTKSDMRVIGKYTFTSIMAGCELISYFFSSLL